MLTRVIRIPVLLSLALLGYFDLQAQCRTATLNWDVMEYFYSTTGNFSPYVTAAAVTTQRFAFGKNVLTVTMGSSITSGGDVATHTGSTGSYGSGDDILYNLTSTATAASARSITLTFRDQVSTFQTSLYDVDVNMAVAVQATNSLGISVPVTLSKPAGGTVTIAGSPGLAPTGTGAAANAAVNANTATLSIDIAGPVKTITITLGTATGDVYLSDMNACVTGNYATNYYQISRPFTGQPSYVLGVHDLNTVYMIDPATGRAVSIFTDNSVGTREVNNLAYDPYRRMIYYSIDGAERLVPAGNPDTVKCQKRYDVNTETFSTIVTSVGNAPTSIVTFNAGLESGGAAFYDSSLYIGVEGYKLSGTRNSTRESSIWRLDFDPATYLPTNACMVWSTPVDNGTNNIHDWADFAINDSVLVDFNSSPTAGNGIYLKYNLQTGAVISSVAGASLKDVPRQNAVGWDGTIYWVSDSIATYNGTNGVNTKYKIVSTSSSVAFVSPMADGGEAFRPKADFGDAPSTYDPVALSPALNEKDTAIRLGATYDWEWNKSSSVDATADGSDEDGLAYVPIFAKSTSAYTVQVSVYNNLATNATLIGWFDYNGNGIFDAAEACTPVTITPSSSQQSVYLTWSGISSPIPNNTTTFLRIRLTSASNGMAAANATGYYNNGETEDYPVVVDDFPLSVNLLDFQANAVNENTVRLVWSANKEDDFSGYFVERSSDGLKWNELEFVAAKGSGSNITQYYLLNDHAALKGRSYYRLRLINKSNSYRYSEVRSVYIADLEADISVMPNPASSYATVNIISQENVPARIQLINMQGASVFTYTLGLNTGKNALVLDNLSNFADGSYLVQVQIGAKTIRKKLIINKAAH